MIQKKMYLMASIIISFMTFSHSAYSQWKFQHAQNELTRADELFSFSPFVVPTSQMTFPYKDVKSSLRVSCIDNKLATYMSFTQLPPIANSNVYGVFKTKIRIDESIQNVSLRKSIGSNRIDFINNFILARQIENGNELIVEIPFVGQGVRYFKFPLKGSKASMAFMNGKCGYRTGALTFEEFYKLALSKQENIEARHINISGEVISISVSADQWTAFDKDRKSKEVIKIALVSLIESGWQSKFAVEVVGSNYRNTIGGRLFPFRGHDLKKIFYKAVSELDFDESRIESFSVSEVDPVYYEKEDGFESLIGYIKSTNEKILITVR